MECLSMIKVRHGEFTYTVPCSKCAFCLMNKRSQWMFRISQEMKNQEVPGWFLTLTYQEKYVKRAPDGRLSLRFRDIQLFIKKIRKAKHYVKYVCVGEYGSKTKRPHYHLLLWTDCPVESLHKFWSTSSGMPLGQIHTGRISMQSAMYALKYIIQPKQREVDGIEKTRAQFSKGLGLSYLSSAMYDYHTFDYEQPNLMAVINGEKMALPRYYKNKIFTKYQMRKEGTKIKWKRIKEYRKEMRRLKASGMPVEKITAYLKGLRITQAERIIKSTKFNQTL